MITPWDIAPRFAYEYGVYMGTQGNVGVAAEGLSVFDAAFVQLMPLYTIHRHLDLGTHHSNRAELVPADLHLYNEIWAGTIADCPQPAWYGNCLCLGEYFPRDWFDVVTALDLIEHLMPENGMVLLDTVERLCSGRIIIFTPLGYYAVEQPEYPTQAHLSGWEPRYFTRRGYTCWVLPAMHNGKGAFYAIRDKHGAIEKPQLSEGWFKNSYWEG